MNSDFSKLVNTFSKIIPRETKVRNAVVAAIKEILNIELDRKKIRVAKDTVYITESSALRSEISMKQEKILARINVQDNELKIKKIQ